MLTLASHFSSLQMAYIPSNDFISSHFFKVSGPWVINLPECFERDYHVLPSSHHSFWCGFLGHQKMGISDDRDFQITFLLEIAQPLFPSPIAFNAGMMLVIQLCPYSQGKHPEKRGMDQTKEARSSNVLLDCNHLHASAGFLPFIQERNKFLPCLGPYFCFSLLQHLSLYSIATVLFFIL